MDAYNILTIVCLCYTKASVTAIIAIAFVTANIASTAALPTLATQLCTGFQRAAALEYEVALAR